MVFYSYSWRVRKTMTIFSSKAMTTYVFLLSRILDNNTACTALLHLSSTIPWKISPKLVPLNRVWYENSTLSFFHESVPPVPMGAISTFYENSRRRYLKVKVNHRQSITPAIKRENFIDRKFFIFCWDALGWLFRIFYLMFTFRSRQADFLASVPTPVSLNRWKYRNKA